MWKNGFLLSKTLGVWRWVNWQFFCGFHYCWTHLTHGATLKTHRLVTICTQGMQYMRKAPNSKTASINCIFFARFCVDFLNARFCLWMRFLGWETLHTSWIVSSHYRKEQEFFLLFSVRASIWVWVTWKMSLRSCETNFF